MSTDNQTSTSPVPTPPPSTPTGNAQAAAAISGLVQAMSQVNTSSAEAKLNATTIAGRGGERITLVDKPGNLQK